MALVLTACGQGLAGSSEPLKTGGGATHSGAISNLPDLGLKNVTTETAAARGLTIGPEGGTISATASNGVQYSLQIPERAVAEPTRVALYPTTAVAGLPAGTNLSAAVQFAPDGLDLLRPATLTITYAAAPGASTVGVAWNGDGADARPYPAHIAGTTATLTVLHFSGAGTGDPPIEPLDECTDQDGLESSLVAGIQEMNTQGSAAYQTLRDALRRCYANFVAPRLQVTSGGDYLLAAREARQAYDTWLMGIGFLPAGVTVEPELDQSKALAATFLRSWYDTYNTACVANAEKPAEALAAAEQAIDMPHNKAPDWGIDTRANRLDYESLLNDLCVKVVIDPSRGFSGSSPGAQGTVTVPVGYAIQDGDVRHDETVHVKLTETGGSSPFAEGDAPSDGNFSAPLTWPSDVTPLRIDVLASMADYPDIAVFDRITKSPGSKFAVSIRDAGGQVRIGVVDSDGRNFRFITSGPSDVHPRWSPNGRQIAFTQSTSGSPRGEAIGVVNADGSGAKALTTGPLDYGPAWSPDGTRIAFLRGHPNTASPVATIVIMNADGTDQVDTGIASGGGAVLSWSPDGQRIAYVDYDDNVDANASRPFRIWVLTVAGGGTRKLLTPACEPWGAAAPDWSPTSDQIAFFCDTHGNPDGAWWIAVMSADGGGYRKVTGNLIDQRILGNPSWSPDGTKFALAGPNGLVVYGASDGTSSTVAAGGSGQVVFWDWGP